jgi:hypothetical protein
MKVYLTRLVATAAALAFVVSGSSCMNTYDANGRAYQTVDPGLAIAGIAAAGIIGYAAANNRSHRHHRHHDDGPYYNDGGGYYRGGGYGSYGRVRSR